MHHWKSLVSTLKNFFKPKHHLNPWHGNNLTIKKRKQKKLWYHFRQQKRPRRKKENENKYLQPWLKFKLSKLSLEVRFFFLPENIRENKARFRGKKAFSFRHVTPVTSLTGFWRFLIGCSKKWIPWILIFYHPLCMGRPKLFPYICMWFFMYH